MTVSDLLTKRCDQRGLLSPAALHRALVDRGVEITYSGVHAWFDRRSRPNTEHMPHVVAILALSDDDRLQLYELPLKEPTTVVSTCDAA